MNSDARAALLAQLDELRSRKPHSPERLFGKSGPAPEQRAEYEEQVRSWNRQYRAVQNRLKAVEG